MRVFRRVRHPASPGYTLFSIDCLVHIDHRQRLQLAVIEMSPCPDRRIRELSRGIAVDKAQLRRTPARRAKIPFSQGTLCSASGGLDVGNNRGQMRRMLRCREPLRPTQIRRADHAGLSRRPGLLRQPLDRVVTVFRFVDQRFPDTFRFKPAAYILNRDRVAVPRIKIAPAVLPLLSNTECEAE